MKTRSFPVEASLACLASFILLLLAGYLILVYPQQMALTTAEGHKLTPVEMLMFSMSRICRNYAVPVFGLLGLAFIGSLLWLVNAMGRSTDPD